MPEESLSVVFFLFSFGNTQHTSLVIETADIRLNAYLTSYLDDNSSFDEV